MADSAVPFKRVLLKISGEGLCRPGQSGLDPGQLVRVAEQIRDAAEAGTEVAIVVGGGNILRGRQFLAPDSRVQRATADYMGMLGTLINALALCDTLESLGCAGRIMTAIATHAVAEPFIRRRAVRHLQKGRLVILAAGTGNPYMTTDTAAALRAAELEADVLLKATKVDGVYSADPMTDSGAERLDRLSYRDVIDRNLKVMDMTAISLCMENRMPIIVFDLTTGGNVQRVVAGERIGTYIGEPAHA